MRKKSLLLVSAAFLSLAASGWAQVLRDPVWAGQFYPADPAALALQINSFLKAAGPPSDASIDLRAVIVPHAGYVYSGKIAARAYALLQGMDIETVIILAPSHRHGFRGCSIYPRGGYKTPLGVAEIDSVLAAVLSEHSGYGFVPQAHAREHAVEVQIPFIQTVLPKAKILPVVMGYPDRKSISRLANSLSEVLPGRKALIVASTDLSHFLSKKDANALDGLTASAIKNMEVESLIGKVESGENVMCGGGGVAAALMTALNWGRASVEILGYADSADAGGSSAEVVGYLAAAISIAAGEGHESIALTQEEKQILLGLARRSIREAVRNGRLPEYVPDGSSLIQKAGAFVTLKKGEELRGCIGFIETENPLYRTVMEAAAFAALQDRRFSPVSFEEIDDLVIEISVLSPLRKIDHTEDIKVGRHGLVISKENRKGLLLPQVATQYAWSRKTFLSQTCLKAGLPSDAWKKGADIYVFEALVFSEKRIRPLPRTFLSGLL